MFDVAKHLGAITRAVEDSTHEGTPVKVVVASRTYPTSVDDLWQAVTDPERIPRWFAAVDGDLRLGGRFQVGHAGQRRRRGRRLRRADAPRHHLGDRRRHVVGRRPPSRAPSDGEESTTLTLRHTADGATPAVLRRLRPGAVGVGWELGLMGLAEHLASGTTIAHDEVEGWGASADGRPS